MHAVPLLPDTARPSRRRFLAEAFASHVEAAHALQLVNTEAIALPGRHTEVAVQLPHVAADLAPPSSSTPPSTWGAEEPLRLAAAPGAAAVKEAVRLLWEGMGNGEAAAWEGRRGERRPRVKSRPTRVTESEEAAG